MRIGLTPTRELESDWQPSRVTVCCLVHIPEQLGYYKHRFDVLKLSLASLLANTDNAFDILVFDNGSCREVVDYLSNLKRQGVIDYLFLSKKNIGIINAWRVMFQAATGDVVAYADDDVLFYPGWLEGCLEVLQRFPRVGMVSGTPVRIQFRYGNRYLDQYLKEYPQIVMKRGHLISDEWDRDFAISTGRDPDRALAKNLRRYDDIELDYNGVRAYSTATHFQFVAPKTAILQAIGSEWEPRIAQGLVEVDQRLDDLGFARLSTSERYVRHIGNIITPSLRNEPEVAELARSLEAWDVRRLWYAPLFSFRPLRGLVHRVANWSFFLSQGQGTRRSRLSPP